MRRVSRKRRNREAEARPVRDALKGEVRACEYCRRYSEPHLLACHEIANGNALRRICLDKRFGLLVVCLEPDFRNQINCHSIVQEWPEAKQLAQLYLVRSRDFLLEDYLRMTNPRAMNRITWEEVEAYTNELLELRTSMVRQ